MEKSASDIPRNDAGEEDFSSLTCSSMQTEELAAQQKRRQERQARTPSEGYPGLAFGSGFSSNTMMRLRIIANELHNISSVQLKRAEGEFDLDGYYFVVDGALVFNRTRTQTAGPNEISKHDELTVAGEMNALGRRIESVDTELKNEEKALKLANEEITEISKVFGPNLNGNEQPGDERLVEIEGLKSRLELIKAMYGLSA